MIDTDKQIRNLMTVVDSYKLELSAKQQQYATDEIRVAKLWEAVKSFENSGMYNSRSAHSNTPRPEWAKRSSELKSLHSEIDTIHSWIKSNSEKLNELQAQYVEWRIFRDVQIDALLSFNYTNTFSSLYGTPNTKYCYIHGVAQCDSKNTDIVLGIDETLPSQEANINFVFLKFKKYFQRIFYKTGSEYKDWFNNLENPVNIYIVGHSLGATDHEILREFFDLTDKKIKGKPLAKISVFYYNEESKISAIKRTIEIIGKDRLVAKVHGNDWTIRFVNQYDPKDGLIYQNQI